MTGCSVSVSQQITLEGSRWRFLPKREFARPATVKNKRSKLKSNKSAEQTYNHDHCSQLLTI